MLIYILLGGTSYKLWGALETIVFIKGEKNIFPRRLDQTVCQILNAVTVGHPNLSTIPYRFS